MAVYNRWMGPWQSEGIVVQDGSLTFDVSIPIVIDKIGYSSQNCEVDQPLNI